MFANHSLANYYVEFDMKAVEKLPLPLLLPLCVTEVVRIGSIIIFPLSIFRANARTGLTMYILAPWNRQPTDNQKTTNRQLTDCRLQGEKVQMNQIVKEIRHPPVRMWCVDYCRIHPPPPPPRTFRLKEALVLNVQCGVHFYSQFIFWFIEAARQNTARLQSYPAVSHAENVQ